MQRLYLYNSGTTGDLVFARSLLREIVAAERFEVTLGVCRDERYLVSDFERRAGVRVIESDYANTATGTVLDLGYMCPDDHTPLDTWIGQYVDTSPCQWENFVETFNRGARAAGINHAIEYDAMRVPMIDFESPETPVVLRRPSVYVDNTRTRDRHCHFVFDLARLADSFPGHDFVCTSPPDTLRDNIVDVSHMNRIELSHLSGECDVLLGMTGDPFGCTLTEVNRFKAKAICGYDARLGARFWDYPESRAEYLGSMDEVVDFLLATMWDKIE